MSETPQKGKRTSAFFAVFAVGALILGGLLFQSEGEPMPLRIAVTSAAQAKLVEDIGGEHVMVLNLVPAETDGTAYKYDGNDLMAASMAHAVFFDSSRDVWMDAFQEEAAKGGDKGANATTVPVDDTVEGEPIDFTDLRGVENGVNSALIADVVQVLEKYAPEAKETFERNGEKVAMD